ncbi:hypothetical protein D918_02254 [Trichuris suis]|nr:hypothetical protein D918_02254 [Trichuris suis]
MSSHSKLMTIPERLTFGVVTSGSHEFEVNFHFHKSDAALVQLAAFVTALKSRAKETVETPEVIRNEVFQGIPVAAAAL